MKKIINGKSYDTDKAAYIGYRDNGLLPTDFSYVCETLYRKRTGEYFLHGEGGAQSKYARPCGDDRWGYGQSIMPLSRKAANKWAQKWLSKDEYEQEFGEVVEDDSRAAISVTLPAHIVAALRERAAVEGISLSAAVESAITL